MLVPLSRRAGSRRTLAAVPGQRLPRSVDEPLLWKYTMAVVYNTRSRIAPNATALEYEDICSRAGPPPPGIPGAPM